MPHSKTFVLSSSLVFFSCQPPESTPPVDAGVVADAGLPDAGLVEAGLPDAGPPDAGSGPATNLVMTLGARTGTFTRAQHGLEPTGGLYVEAHFGGDLACPTQTSPTPDRTLIIAGLQPLLDGGVQTEADGLRVSLLDFTGALTNAPIVRSVSARATAHTMIPGTLVSFTLEAAFDGGTLSGAFAAPHCASLDGP